MDSCRYTAVVLLLLSFDLSAAVYYVDSITGNNTNPGTTAAAPWQTLAKAVASATSSDQVLFKSRTGVWRLAKLPASSGKLGGNLQTTKLGNRYRAKLPVDAGTRPLVTPSRVAPSVSPTNGTANCCANNGFTEQSFIGGGHTQKIKRAGTITQIRFAWNTKVGTGTLTTLYFQIWRKDGSTFDQVASQVVPHAGLTLNAINTVTLTTPIAVQEGDVPGMRCTYSGGAANYFIVEAAAGADSYYMNGSVPATSNYNWTAQLPVTDFTVPIEMLFNSGPTFVTMGDSLISGANGNCSYVDPQCGAAPSSQNPANAPGYHVAATLGVPWQNVGIWGQTTTQMAARYTRDVVQANPRFAILEGGMNDVFNSASQATFIANYTAMLSANQTAGIRSVVMLIQPCTGATNAEMTTRDTWNAALRVLADSYAGTIVIDPNPGMGTFRTGGTAGNLWDFAATYGDPDGLHLTPTGAAKYGQIITDVLSTALLP